MKFSRDWPWLKVLSSTNTPRDFKPQTTTLNTDILNEYVQNVEVALNKAMSTLVTHDYLVKRKAKTKSEHLVGIARKHLSDAKDAMHELKKYVSGEDSP